MARPRHCLSATHGWPSLNNSQYSSPTLYTHTRCRPTRNLAAVDSQTGRWHGRSEEGWRVGRRKGEEGVRGGRGGRGGEGGEGGEGNEGGRGWREGEREGGREAGRQG